MRILFMGTPIFAKEILQELYIHHEIVSIFTKPDKPNQRGNKVKYSPVKEFGIKNNIKVLQPKKLKDNELYNQIKEMNIDIAVIVAYGKIIPLEMINIPKFKSVNIHASLLPKLRGSSPIHSAITSGEKTSGVSIMYINEKLDEGDVILKKEVEIDKLDTVGTLHDKLINLSKEAINEALELIESGKEVREKQDHSLATFTKQIGKMDCKIDWEEDTIKIYNKIRGLSPFPCSFAVLNDKKIKLYNVRMLEEELSGENGEVVKVIKGKGPVVKTKNGGILILNAKPENKKNLTGVDLINGKHIAISDKFE